VGGKDTPIAVENLGAFSLSTPWSSWATLVVDRAQSCHSDEAMEGSLLFQRLSVVIQRFNSVLLHQSFADDNPD